jgi:glutamine amidotransferase PdxT
MKIGVALQGNFREHLAMLARLGVDGVEVRPLRGVFIRAPRAVEAGPEVDVLARLGGEPVLLRQGRCLAAAFHPELTDDTRVHELFVEMVREEMHVRS